MVELPPGSVNDGLASTSSVEWMTGLDPGNVLLVRTSSRTGSLPSNTSLHEAPGSVNTVFTWPRVLRSPTSVSTGGVLSTTCTVSVLLDFRSWLSLQSYRM